MFLGSLLLQTAWILTLPPFRGADEFDHAYRAASVAAGHWGPSRVSAEHGRGDLVRVPESLVVDAQPMCSSLKYTGRDNCEPVQRFDDGTVTVASAAARYNPAFYAAIGTPAKLFDGAASLDVMRLVGAALCSLFLAIAAWTIARWARTVWPLAALALVCTPVLVYSTAVAAPNGAEMCAAAGLAYALFGLRKCARGDEAVLLAVGTGFAVVLTTLRTLGPLFVLCIVALAIVYLGARTSAALVRRHKALVAIGTVVVGAATAASVWWIRLADANALEPVDAQGNPFLQTIEWLPLWFLQSIAAFPLRNEPAHPAVYGAGLVVLGGAIVLAVVTAERRDRLVLLGALALSIAVPVALQTKTYAVSGAIWQGRYGWPLALSVIVLVGMSLDSTPPSRRVTLMVTRVGAVTWSFAHLLSIMPLVVREQRGGVYAHDARWITASPLVIGLIAVSGLVLWAWAVATTHAPQPEPRRDTTAPGRAGLPDQSITVTS